MEGGFCVRAFANLALAMTRFGVLRTRDPNAGLMLVQVTRVRLLVRSTNHSKLRSYRATRSLRVRCALASLGNLLPEWPFQASW